MANNQIIQAWKAVPTEKGILDFPNSIDPFYVVKYADGTGNVVELDGKRMYAIGVEFWSVEDHMKHPDWTTTTEVDPSEVPASR